MLKINERAPAVVELSVGIYCDEGLPAIVSASSGRRS
jgi:hypothetical protein